jgi:Transposase IS116/IS110/IS902 family
VIAADPFGKNGIAFTKAAAPGAYNGGSLPNVGTQLMSHFIVISITCASGAIIGPTHRPTTSLRQPDGDPIPQKAKARIERLLDRLDLVLKLIEQVESARDAILKKDAPADEAERMIRSLTDLRSIGPDFATLLVREAFVRQFRNRRALGGYVGLGGTPFSSGGSEREQGIGKDGNRRVRAAMVELAWTWLAGSRTAPCPCGSADVSAQWEGGSRKS